MAVSVWQANYLKNVVGEAAIEQKDAIKNVSGNTMSQVIDGSMTKTNALQSYIADDMFSDVKARRYAAKPCNRSFRSQGQL